MTILLPVFSTEHKIKVDFQKKFPNSIKTAKVCNHNERVHEVDLVNAVGLRRKSLCAVQNKIRIFFFCYGRVLLLFAFIIHLVLSCLVLTFLNFHSEILYTQSKVGFMNPDKNGMKNPDYRAVCSGQTGHVEVLNVELADPSAHYKELLRFFFSFHDPTTMNRQVNL